MLIRKPILLAALLCMAAPALAQQPTTAPQPTTRPAITLPASVEPYEQTDLHPRAAGYIVDVKVDIGDTVTAGKPLATIAQPELDKELAEAKAMQAAKEQMLKAADAAVLQSKETLNVAIRQVARYKADAALQEITLRRQEELFTGKAATEQQRDEARNKYEVAKADADIAAAKAAAAESDMKGVEAAREVAAAQVTVAEAQVAKIETMKSYLEITAPFDGIVIRRQVNRGDLAQIGGNKAAPLFTMQRIDRLRIRCDVPESSAPFVDKGTPATIKLVTVGGETINATITRTAKSLSPETRTMRAEIELPNTDSRLLPGMYVQVTLTPGGK